MARELLLITLGILIALSPYLGLPLWILNILLPVFGIAVAAIGFVARANLKRRDGTASLPSYDPPAR